MFRNWSYAYHGHSVQLLQGRHRLEQEHDESASLDRLDCPRQQVGGQGLKILQHTHAIGVAENFVRVLVVSGHGSAKRSARCGARDARVADVCDGDEDLKRVLLVSLTNAALDIALDFRLAFLAVAAPRVS